MQLDALPTKEINPKEAYDLLDNPNFLPYVRGNEIGADGVFRYVLKVKEDA